MSFELRNPKMLIFFIRKIVYIFGVEKYLKTAVPEKPKKSRGEIIYMRKTFIIIGLILLAIVAINAQTKDDFYRRNAKDKIKELKKEGWEYDAKYQALEDKLISFYRNGNSYLDFTGFSISKCLDIENCIKGTYLNAIKNISFFRISFIKGTIDDAIKKGLFESDDRLTNYFIDKFSKELFENLQKTDIDTIILKKKTNDGFEMRMYCQIKEYDLSVEVNKSFDSAAASITTATTNQNKILNFINSDLRKRITE